MELECVGGRRANVSRFTDDAIAYAINVNRCRFRSLVADAERLSSGNKFTLRNVACGIGSADRYAGIG